MTGLFARLAQLLARDGAVALVTVLEVKGSVPREPGARMIVSKGGAIAGTIGGGRLEREAIEAAVGRLGDGAGRFEIRRFALGPQLGQCCGGHVTLGLEVFAESDADDLARLVAVEAQGPFRTEADILPGAPLRRRISEADPVPGEPAIGLGDGRLAETFGVQRRPVFLFGAGHVGRALVMALAPLPFAVTWIDARAEMFPSAMPGNVRPVALDKPASAASAITDEALVLIMTHDHATDLEILAAVLGDTAAPYVGMIGSATKRARFESRLASLGFDEARSRAFRCPIGVPGIRSKEPAAIAASVAAELLIEHERIAALTAGTEASEIVAVSGSNLQRRA